MACPTNLTSWLCLLLLHIAAAAARLQTLPAVDWHYFSDEYFTLAEGQAVVYVAASAARVRDTDGLTLIPPSTLEFATTFAADLGAIFGGIFSVRVVGEKPSGGIYLSLGKDLRSSYENGDATTEGYELVVGRRLVEIRGAGARGVWWGTRTLLQELLLTAGGKIRTGFMRDAPAYRTRGFMLDAGRKWYSLPFLKDLCSYASFFKLSEFHYHASDNYPLNRGHNETWSSVYSQFSLYPEDPALQGIIIRKNETLGRREFEEFQYHCAQRGITVIPEIEAPGHALAITKWRPQLALDKKDLLNLTHPETIPTVKAIWDSFLPWFATKEVHIGADEYNPALANVYISFVNEMSSHIRRTTNKRIRIWGTNEPSATHKLSKDIIIQHWQYGESDPVALAADGYDVINSEDWWGYVSLKNDHTPIFPATYPQRFNTTRTLNFANTPGWQWEPSLFNPFNTSAAFQLPKTSGRNKGAVAASWNDNGPDATTQLEAFYAWRDGLPVVGARAWSGGRGALLETETLPRSISILSSAAPGQNLDRRLRYPSIDISCRGDHTHLGFGSKGMNYTLTIWFTSAFTLSSADTTLSLTSDGALGFVADGIYYPLRAIRPGAGYDPAHPGRIWGNETSSTHEEVTVPLAGTLVVRTDQIGGTRVWMGKRFLGRFEVKVWGGRNRLVSWSQMAFVAPLEEAAGGVVRVRVVDGLREVLGDT